MLVELQHAATHLAIFGLIGSAVASGLSYKIAKENRQWQERMSNTAYQRGMKDMRLAGLNPILAYKQGGASSPAGSTSIVQDPTSSVVAAYMAKKQADLVAQQEATSAEQAATIHQDRVNKLPEQELGALKNTILLNAAKGTVHSAKQGYLKKLTITPDFDNFLDKKNPKGSYIDRGLESLNRMRKGHGK